MTSEDNTRRVSRLSWRNKDDDGDDDLDGYGEGLGWLSPETQEAMTDSVSVAKNTDDEYTDVQRHKGNRAKVRRLVVLRGSHTAEVSGAPVMEIRG